MPTSPLIVRATTRLGQSHIDIHASPGTTVQQALSEHTVSLIAISGGSAMIGSDTDFPDEGPRHVVDVPTFAIGVYPVTNHQYSVLLDAVPATPRPRYWHDGRFNAPNQPVVGVSWHAAVAYTDWLTRELSGQLNIGHVVRLPSTAEWEKAAAWDPARQVPRRYPWGDTWNPDGVHAATANAAAYPLPVGNRPAGMSAYGVHDMLGNVWEWTASISTSYPGTAAPVVEVGSYVIRGGSCALRPTHMRCTYHCRLPASYWRYHLGFRIVIALPEMMA
jgi:formylglycine-generating enzyme required for sulfatase activity